MGIFVVVTKRLGFQYAKKRNHIEEERFVCPSSGECRRKTAAACCQTPIAPTHSTLTHKTFIILINAAVAARCTCPPLLYWESWLFICSKLHWHYIIAFAAHADAPNRSTINRRLWTGSATATERYHLLFKFIYTMCLNAINVDPFDKWKWPPTRKLVVDWWMEWGTDYVHIIITTDNVFPKQ